MRDKETTELPAVKRGRGSFLEGCLLLAACGLLFGFILVEILFEWPW